MAKTNDTKNGTKVETSYDTIFGRMAVNQGLCTPEELQQASGKLKKFRESHKDNPVMLKDVMVKLGYVTPNQAERLKRNIKKSKATAHQIPGYKILGKLGAGAMAIVYEAKQLSLNRTVAVKVLPKKFSENPEYVERFYKEGQAAAKLNHPNIVQAIDVGEAGGYHYFVMEFVKGKTIYDDINAGKIFPEKEALEITIQVAEALAHAHSCGLIHRDVKPKNIMINQENIVKLADMGLARMTSDIEAAESEQGKAYGTPYYIAPEQIRGEIDVDGRVDIYGLGATLYHMVTGRVPFMADDPKDVMRKHLKEPLTPPDHINTSLSAGTSEVIEMMLAKKREDRYQDVNELLEDLNALKDDQPPIHARKNLDISELRQLEEGEEIEQQRNYEDDESSVDTYRIAVIILSLVSALLLVGLIISIATR